MARFNWLHLSDLHHGMSEQLSHWPNVREIFYRDLATIHERSGPWDLLLFTGDLTQQGSRGEFGRLDALLDHLLGHLRKLGSEPVLLAVPGNHDLVRPRSIDPAVKALKRWAEEDDIRADFWSSEDSDYRKVVAKAFAPFAEFWRRRSELLPVAVTHGLLPGDFSTEIERDGVRLGIVGLNSSFLQLTGESYEKKLDLDIRQLNAACGGDATKWLEDKSEVLLLTHHPVDWLRDERRFARDIAPPGRFAAHLFGHMHEPQSELFSRGGSPFQCRLQGASLFGLEKLSSGGEDRIYGYGAGRLEIHEEATTLRYWPRRAVRKSLGHYRLQPNPEMDLSDDGSTELRLKESAPAKRGGATRAAAPKAFDDLLGSYRRRLQPIYERWPQEPAFRAATPDLTAAADVRFEDAYHPLRLGGAGDGGRKRPDAADELRNLIKSKPRILVEGAGGTGKTTWLRWVFQTLLRTEGALPIMVVLHRLGMQWQKPDCRGEQRSLDAFIDDWGAQYGVEGWKGRWRELLGERGIPAPILLLDGWDEVGHLGGELKDKLSGFLSQYPRVRVIVTSRGYGKGVPSEADGFERIELSPLSDEDIRRFAHRFFESFGVSGERNASAEAARFLQALDHSPAAAELARTPLLLTLMLQVDQAHALPDKRHLLYELCIDRLLSALPDRKLADGALHLSSQWRPADKEERKWVVAALAANLKRLSDNDGGAPAAIACSIEQMEALLPAAWPADAGPASSQQERRRAFLAWLAGPAGLLLHQAGTLSFTHLCFQEYLAAWHLNQSIEGDEDRVRAFLEMSQHANAWETLLLWASMLHGANQERTRPILAALLDNAVLHDRRSLAGMMLANGVGDERAFRRWLDDFVFRASTTQTSTLNLCMTAWAGSRQHRWRDALAERLRAEAERGHLLARVRIHQTARRCRIDLDAPLPPESTVARDVMEVFRTGVVTTARAVPAWRILCEVDPEVTALNRHPEILLLHALWPSVRRTAGWHLLLAAAAGADRRGLRCLASYVLHPPEPSPTLDAVQRHVLGLLAGVESAAAKYSDEENEAGFGAMRKVIGDVFAEVRAQGKPLQPWASSSGFSFRTFAGSLLREAPGIFLQTYGRRTSPRPLDLPLRVMETLNDRAAARQMELDPEEPWFASYQRLVGAQGGISTKVALLSGEHGSALPALLGSAYHLSKDPDDPAKLMSFDALTRAIAPHCDSLWPAFARHVARRSSEEDRALLTELAARPELREPPLSWILKYVVRGDVPLNDGSEVTLDELSMELGYPTRPYLEEMPDSPDANPEQAETTRRYVTWVDRVTGAALRAKSWLNDDQS
ncbi:hypothetical protein BE21_21130 [Sorangium cellulosum]|uniref:NACHT domain-containing protein n=1 Tax=Sorangium cellulosum TaxID=56 RepID=A0A150TWA8_SORCE|nr:hypothetical protein BE21_21130 [Sorangium cellulosum]